MQFPYICENVLLTMLTHSSGEFQHGSSKISGLSPQLIFHVGGSVCKNTYLLQQYV